MLSRTKSYTDTRLNVNGDILYGHSADRITVRLCAFDNSDTVVITIVECT
jgi:hypothetical protein